MYNAINTCCNLFLQELDSTERGAGGFGSTGNS